MRVLILFTVLCIGITVGKADSVPKKSAALFTPEQIQRARQHLSMREACLSGMETYREKSPHGGWGYPRCSAWR